MAGDDVLSDEAIDELIAEHGFAAVPGSLRRDLVALLRAVAHPAQQRERERREDIVASLVDTVNTIHREHHLAPCDVPHPVTDTLESLRDGVWQIAYAKVRSEQRHAAEVRELRAALRTAEQQRDHWRRECSDIQERAALSTKAGG
jgi:hypothetical protein